MSPKAVSLWQQLQEQLACEHAQEPMREAGKSLHKPASADTTAMRQFEGQPPAPATPCTPSPHYLGVFNVGLLRAPISDPLNDEFRSALAPVNAFARSTPGFVWMLEGDADAAAIPELVANPLLYPQMSVWQSLRALRHFVFKSGHSVYLRRRKEWFAPLGGEGQPPYAVLWTRPCDAPPPSLAEAYERLRHLGAHGPSRYAFSLANAKEFLGGGGDGGRQEEQPQ